MTDVGIRILIVEDDAVQQGLLRDLLKSAGHLPTAARNVPEALGVLAREPIALVLADIVMPGRSGLDLLRELRATRPDLAVILMSGVMEIGVVIEALRQGAADYVTKPVNDVELLVAIDRAWDRRRLLHEVEDYRRNLEAKVKEQTRALEAAIAAREQTWEAALWALVDALDAREQETERHSIRVMRFTEMVAKAYGVDEAQMQDISRGALLHDIGKIGIPDAILLKPAGLSEAEWEVMRSHAQIGWQILRGIEYLVPAAEMVYAHQERWDGTGYPRGMKAEEIPLGARLFAIVDAFDAIVSDRPYRKGKSVEWAREEIRRCAGTQFDPKVVDAFLSIPVEEWTRMRHELEQVEKARKSPRMGDDLMAQPVPPAAKLRPA